MASELEHEHRDGEENGDEDDRRCDVFRDVSLGMFAIMPLLVARR